MSGVTGCSITASANVDRERVYMISPRTIVMHPYTFFTLANPALVALDLIMADLVARAHRKLDAATPKEGTTHE